MRILLRRAGALGDVILTTPVVRRLASENFGAEIVVETAYPQVYWGSHYATAFNRRQNPLDFDRVIDLDLAYERQPLSHIVTAYMLTAFGNLNPAGPGVLRQELTYDPAPLFRRDPQHPFVAVHAAQAGWRNRTLPRQTWVQVVQGLRRAGCQPILVGSPADALDGVHTRSFLHADLPLQARLIASCDVFVGSDSALLHVAGATDTPIVGVFTSVNPIYRLPFRDNCHAVSTSLPCKFCHGRAQAPTIYESCERGDTACVTEIAPQMIIDKVLKVLQR